MIVKIISKTADGFQYGTGFFLNSNFLYTCYHVVKNSEHIHIAVNNDIYNGHILEYNENCDICKLKTDYKPPTVFKYGYDINTKVSTNSYWANEFTKFTQYANVICKNYNTNEFPTALLLDLKSHKGMSGAPIFNEYNEVVSFILWDCEMGTGCLNIQLFNKYIKGSYECGTLPFTTKKLDTHDIVELNNVYGEKVTSSYQHLEPGDVITHINGKLLNELDLKTIVFMYPKKYSMKLTVRKKRFGYKRISRFLINSV